MPREELLAGAASREGEVVYDNIAALSGMVGCNEFLLEELDSYKPLLSLAAALALCFARKKTYKNNN